MTGLPGGAFFVGVRGLAGAWRVMDGFLAGSWRAQICARKWLSRGGRVWLSKGVGGFGFRKGWEGFGFRGVEGLAFERGGGGWMLGHAWGSGAWGWGGWGWACLGLDARAFGVGRGLLPFLLPFGALRQTHYLCNR